jgi:hypothetical protein
LTFNQPNTAKNNFDFMYICQTIFILVEKTLNVSGGHATYAGFSVSSSMPFIFSRDTQLKLPATKPVVGYRQGNKSVNSN